MPREPITGAPRAPAALTRLRWGIVVGLAASIGFVPLELAGPHSPLLPWVYGWHWLSGLGILIATFTPLARHATACTIAFVATQAGGLLTYEAVAPSSGLVTSCLILLLGGSTVLFGWSVRQTLAVGAAICAAFAVQGIVGDGMLGTSFATGMANLLVCTALCVLAAGVLNRQYLALEGRRAELEILSAKLLRAEEAERGRLSRELHDEFGQALTAASARLWLIERRPAADDVVEHAREARRLITETLGGMREVARLLRPPGLEQVGLAVCLEQQAREFAAHHGVAVDVDAAELDVQIPLELATALYRITQEALTNVARHARASTVRVRLAVEGERLLLVVEDDGIGFAPGHAPGAGLLGIRERAHAFGGEVTVEHLSPGTRLALTVPREREPAEGAEEPAPAQLTSRDSTREVGATRGPSVVRARARS